MDLDPNPQWRYTRNVRRQQEVTTLDVDDDRFQLPDQLQDGIPYAVIPKTALVHNLEHLLPEPLRIKRSVTLHVRPASPVT